MTVCDIYHILYDKTMVFITMWKKVSFVLVLITCTKSGNIYLLNAIWQLIRKCSDLTMIIKCNKKHLSFN